MFPLIGKLKTMTKKKPYLFTSCFHSGGEQETLWVYYLASCECKDVRPRYVFVCSGGRVITQGAVPLAVSTQAQRLCPTQPCPHAAWLGNAAGLGYRAALLWQICPGQDLTHSSSRAFVFLVMLLSLLLFILMIFFFSHPLLPVGCLSSGALKVSLVLWTWHKGTSLLCPSQHPPPACTKVSLLLLLSLNQLMGWPASSCRFESWGSDFEHSDWECRRTCPGTAGCFTFFPSLVLPSTPLPCSLKECTAVLLDLTLPGLRQVPEFKCIRHCQGKNRTQRRMKFP